MRADYLLRNNCTIQKSSETDDGHPKDERKRGGAAGFRCLALSLPHNGRICSIQALDGAYAPLITMGRGVPHYDLWPV